MVRIVVLRHFLGSLLGRSQFFPETDRSSLLRFRVWGVAFRFQNRDNNYEEQ